MSEHEDEIEVELRTPRAVAARMMLLAATVRRAMLEIPVDEETYDAGETLSDTPEGERFDLLTALDAPDLRTEIVAWERSLLEANVGTVREDDVLVASWQIEALATLVWAAGGAETMPPPWEQAAPGPVLAMIPELTEDVSAFSTTLDLRDEQLIADERERAELWSWRAAIENELPYVSAAERAELEDAIAEVADDIEHAGLFPIAGDDFAVRGRAFASVDDETQALITEISTHRLRALNWLCGFGDAWDTVPLDIE